MIIPNFNFHPKQSLPWASLKKTYITPLALKVQSLIDYYLMFNPSYADINSLDWPVSDTGTIDVDGNSYTILWLDNMKYRQTIINTHNEKAICLGIKNTNFGWEGLFDCFGNIHNKEYADFLFDNFEESFCIFKSGYAIQLNMQPLSLSDYFNFANFTIMPVGNGAYYRPYFSNDMWIWKYYETDIGNLSNIFSFSLVPSGLRYYLTKFHQWPSSLRIKELYATQKNDLTQDFIIASKIENGSMVAWQGEPLLTPFLFKSNEEVISDVFFSYGSVIREQERVSSIRLHLQHGLKDLSVQVL